MKALKTVLGSTLWVRQAWALVCLMRPLNLIMIVAGVVLGGLLSAGIDAVQGDLGARLLKAALSASSIGGAANVLNDVFDVEIDRINRPGRPLPSGLVPVWIAHVLVGVGAVVGVVLAALLTLTHLALALGVIGLLLAYNAYLKHKPLVGNLVIALVLSVALVYGGWAVGPVGPALVGAAFAFLTTLARELIKDVEDVRGDAAAGARTLPLVWGSHKTLRLVLLIVFITLFLTPLPFLLLDFTGLFLVLMLIADALLLRVLWLLFAPHAEACAGQTSRVMKGVMFAGMVALALGAVVEVGG